VKHPSPRGRRHEETLAAPPLAPSLSLSEDVASEASAADDGGEAPCSVLFPSWQRLSRQRRQIFGGAVSVPCARRGCGCGVAGVS
jgi:hypothetical protein